MGSQALLLVMTMPAFIFMLSIPFALKYWENMERGSIFPEGNTPFAIVFMAFPASVGSTPVHHKIYLARGTRVPVAPSPFAPTVRPIGANVAITAAVVKAFPQVVHVVPGAVRVVAEKVRCVPGMVRAFWQLVPVVPAIVRMLSAVVPPVPAIVPMFPGAVRTVSQHVPIVSGAVSPVRASVRTIPVAVRRISGPVPVVPGAVPPVPDDVRKVPGAVRAISVMDLNLMVVRHVNTQNNHQFQLASSYAMNDRLFFRKIAAELTPYHSNWIELATRGPNTFLGNQTFIGNVGIGTSTPSNHQGWNKVLDVNGVSHSKILATVNGDTYRTGIFSHNEEWHGGGGFVGTESNHNLFLITGYSPKMAILTNGNVLVGKTTQSNSTYKLDVVGKIRADEIVVNTTGADFVFEPGYKLRTLSELETFIRTNKHLPDITPAKEMQENGVSAGEMQAKLLQKVEELTLYVIEKDKEITALQTEYKKAVDELRAEIELLKNK